MHGATCSTLTYNYPSFLVGQFRCTAPKVANGAGGYAFIPGYPVILQASNTINDTFVTWWDVQPHGYGGYLMGGDALGCCRVTPVTKGKSPTCSSVWSSGQVNNYCHWFGEDMCHYGCGSGSTDGAECGNLIPGQGTGCYNCAGATGTAAAYEGWCDGRDATVTVSIVDCPSSAFAPKWQWDDLSDLAA